jgi:hypothetical protein
MIFKLLFGWTVLCATLNAIRRKPYPPIYRLESGMRKLRIQVWWEIDGVFLRMLR